MINSLFGTVSGKMPGHLFLEYNGIEWDILVSDKALDIIAPVGNTAKIFTYLQHTDQLMNLFGFPSVEDRNLFFDLLKVDGIGPKAALKILSNTTSQNLASVIDSGDVGVLEKIPGIGKKTAAKMLLQLKGKLTLEDSSDKADGSGKSEFETVINGLSEMGYDKKLVKDAVNRLAAQKQKEGGFDGLSQTEKEDMLFRLCIVELAN